MYPGYTPQTDIGIEVSLFDDAGNCVGTTGNGTSNTKKIKFKHNVDISCIG